MNSGTFLSVSVLIGLATACGGNDLGPSGETPDAADTSGCLETVEPQESGEHNPGLDCMSSGCHDGSSDAPTWTLAGTLYTDVGGSAPRPGAHIVVVDAAQNELVLQVAQNGNFYTDEEVTFPVQVRGTACPEDMEMSTPVDASSGSCNKSGCHASGFRAFVP